MEQTERGKHHAGCLNGVGKETRANMFSKKKKEKRERTENLVKKVKEGRERTQWVTVTINGVRKRERIYKKTGSKS